MTTNKRVTVAIIGGGVAGISAANYFDKKNIDYIIIEKENILGGLLRPLNYKGFTFDRAVHLSFATEKEVRSEFDKTEYITHKPNSYNWDQNVWLRHPVQNNLFPLDLQRKINATKSLIEASNIKIEINNYSDWLYSSYGKYFAENYPAKYTKKYWRYSPEHLDIDWLGPRMVEPDLDLVLEGAMSQTKKNTYYVKEMRYPKEGSYYKFIKNMANNVKAMCSESVSEIDVDKNRVTTSSGKEIIYSYIINTSPLPSLVRMLRNAPTNILECAEGLEATSVDLISIGMKTHIDFKSLWFYIYDEDIYASRCYSPSIKSVKNAPAEQSSIQFEIYSVANESAHNTEKLKENCIYALQKMNICSPDDIQFIEHHREEYANVIFKKGTSVKAATLVEWLKLQKIHSAGRFGEWKYLWSNQSYMSGLNAAKNIVDELTHCAKNR